MIRSNQKKSSFVYEEEFDQNQLAKPPHLSVDMVLLIVIVFASGEEYEISNDNNALFQLLFPYIASNSQSILDNKILSIALPDNIDISLFELYVTYLSSLTPPKADFALSKKLISLSFFFHAKDQMKKIIAYNILPNIDKSTCLNIISDYSSFTSDDHFSELCNEMLLLATITAANNIFFLIYNYKDTLLELPDAVFDDILEKYFESVIINQNIDHSLIISLMMNKRNINNDIFALLEYERKYSIGKFEKTRLEDTQSPLTWKIHADNPQNDIYKESEEFVIKNVSIMLINYYDHSKDVFNMALKISEIKESDNDNDNYNDNSDDITNINKQLSQDDLMDSMSHLSSNVKFIISLLSICEIKEIKHKSKINFNCIFSNSKNKVLITKIDDFSQKFKELNIPFNQFIDFTLNIYFSISYNFSSILTHICKNFYQYHTLPSLSIISKNVLNIILRNEDLNVNNEDEVLTSVLTWLNGRTHITSEIILEVIKNINWSLLSNEALFDFISSQSRIILSSNELQQLLSGEFQSRFKEERGVDESESYIETALSKLKVKRRYIKEGSMIFNMKKNSFCLDMIVNICKSLNRLSGQNKSTSSPNFELPKEVLLNNNMNNINININTGSISCSNCNNNLSNINQICYDGKCNSINNDNPIQNQKVIGKIVQCASNNTNNSPITNVNTNVKSTIISSGSVHPFATKRNYALNINNVNSNTLSKSKDERANNARFAMNQINCNNNNANNNYLKNKPGSKSKEKKGIKSKSVVNERKPQSNKQSLQINNDGNSPNSNSNYTGTNIVLNQFPNYTKKPQHKCKSTSKTKMSPSSNSNNIVYVSGYNSNSNSNSNACNNVNCNLKSTKIKKKAPTLIEIAKKESKEVLSPYHKRTSLKSPQGTKKKDETRPKSVI